MSTAVTDRGDLDVSVTPLAMSTIDGGSGLAKAATTSWTTPSDIPANSLVCGALSVSTGGSAPVVSVGSLTLTSRFAASGTGVLAYILTATTPSLISAGSTVSVSVTGASGLACAVFSIPSGFDTTTPLEFSANATGSSGTPTAQPSANPTFANSLQFCVLATNGPIGDAFAQVAGFTTPPTRAGTTGGSATTNFTVAGGVQTNSTRVAYNPTIASRAWAETVCYVRAFSGPPVGTLSLTQGNNTLSATGWSTAVGNLTATQANNTISATGWSTALASLTATQANQTLSSQGRVLVVGTLGATQVNQTISATGGIAPATAVLNITETPDTIVAVGSVIVGGILTATQANQTLAAVGRVTVGGALNLTQDPNTLASVGRVAVAGGLGITQNPQTLLGNGAVFSGASANLTATQANQTLSAIGAVTGLVGLLNLVQGSQILVGTGSVRVAGGLGVVQDSQTLVAAGMIVAAPVSGLQARALVMA